MTQHLMNHWSAMIQSLDSSGRFDDAVSSMSRISLNYDMLVLICVTGGSPPLKDTTIAY